MPDTAGGTEGAAGVNVHARQGMLNVMLRCGLRLTLYMLLHVQLQHSAIEPTPTIYIFDVRHFSLRHYP